MNGRKTIISTLMPRKRKKTTDGEDVWKEVVDASIQTDNLPSDALIWNNFIKLTMLHDYESLTEAQKKVDLAFQYDADMQVGGHTIFFEWNPEIKLEELVNALEFIGANAFIDNLKIAWKCKECDNHLNTDRTFTTTQPSLTNILMKYIVSHADELLPDLQIEK